LLSGSQSFTEDFCDSLFSDLLVIDSCDIESSGVVAALSVSPVNNKKDTQRLNPIITLRLFMQTAFCCDLKRSFRESLVRIIISDILSYFSVVKVLQGKIPVHR
jgi:hypothetical protein